jgi:hypothetical protein
MVSTGAAQRMRRRSGLMGLGRLAVVMEMALSALAELSALLPGRRGRIGTDPRSQPPHVLRRGTRRPHVGGSAPPLPPEGATAFWHPDAREEAGPWVRRAPAAAPLRTATTW